MREESWKKGWQKDRKEDHHKKEQMMKTN